MLDKPPNEDLHWYDIPETVNPKDYLQQMAEADSKPGDARKRAYSNLRYAREKGWIQYAAPPRPEEHVFTLSFYRWLLHRYPKIQGLPIATRVCRAPALPFRLALGIPTCFLSEPYPSDPGELRNLVQRLERENRAEKKRSAGLERKLETANSRIAELERQLNLWKARDAQRRRDCGRRPDRKK